MTKVANETSDNGKSLRRLRGRTISLSHRTSDCKSGTASRTASTRRAGVQHLHPKNTKEQQQQNDALERPIVVDFVTAKADFVQVTRAAVSKLMEQHGFSRERAVETLSRTIARMNNSATAASIAASSSLKKEQPSCRPDLEVFNVMRKYGFGIEDATSVSSVASAILDVSRRNGEDVSLALQRLTTSIAHVEANDQQQTALYSPVFANQKDKAKITTTSKIIAPSPFPPVGYVASSSASHPAAFTQNETPTVVASTIPIVGVTKTGTPQSTTTTNPRKEGKTKHSDKKTATPKTISSTNSKEHQLHSSSRPRADSFAEAVSDKLSAAESGNMAAIKGPGGKPPMNGITSTRTGTKRLRSAVSSSDAGESHATSSSPLVPTSSIATPSNGNVASSGAGAATGTASANKRSRRSSSTAGSTGINGGNGN